MVMIDGFLVSEGTVVAAKGDSESVAIEASGNRVFLVTLGVAKIVEQEALEISVYGAADGQTWLPLLVFPQRFYVGETALLLDLSNKPEVKHLRAHWEVNRWGRGSEAPMFEIAVSLREVPQEILASSRASS